jgi:hypothetical protein
VRSFVFYFLVLPALVMIALGVLRVRFAVAFWRRMYLVGLVWVAVVLIRVAYTLIW